MKSWWLLLILPLWLGVTSVRAEYFTISLYQVDVNITPEGYADFHETITVEFSEPRHGIFRAIPYHNVVNGKSTDFLFENIKVDGFKFTSRKENNNIMLRIGDADKYVDGKQVYHIYYRILNPLFFYDDHSEFYWDLLGINWDVEVASFNFNLTVPQQVILSDTVVYWYTGAEGLQGQDGLVTISPKKITGHTTRVFQPKEGFTIAIKFPKDAFRAMDDSTLFFKKHGLLLAPILFLLAGIFAKVFSRNKRQTIMTEYYPPEGISPAIAGGFVDHSVDNNDVLCLIPHLANQGYLKLETREGGFLQKDNIIFTKLKDPQPELYGFERDFLNGLFSRGEIVELKQLRDRFYTTMASVKASVKGWITSQGWYEADQRKFGCLVGVVGLIALAWGAYAIFARQNFDGLALIGAGVVLFILAGTFNKRSPLGNETYRKFEGFRQFVAKAERPVIERLLKDDPHYYDKTMAFALAFGYLKQWNHQFDGLLTQPPSWYSGPMMYGSNSMDSWTNFANNFPSEVNNIGSVFSSSPSSSGSGGGGGGGFSGGGGGGGGGGSW